MDASSRICSDAGNAVPSPPFIVKTRCRWCLLPDFKFRVGTRTEQMSLLLFPSTIAVMTPGFFLSVSWKVQGRARIGPNSYCLGRLGGLLRGRVSLPNSLGRACWVHI